MTDILEAATSFAGTPYALPPDGVTTLDCSLFVIKAAKAADRSIPPEARTAEQIRWALPSRIPFPSVIAGDLLFFEKTYFPREQPGPDGLLATHVGISLGAGTFKMWDANDARGHVGITDITTSYWQSRLIEARRLPDTAPTLTTRRALHLTDSGVRLRSFPSRLKGRILVSNLGPAGTAVQPIDTSGWTLVRTASGDVGWAASQYLRPVDASPATDPAGLSMEPDHEFTFAELWPHIESAAALHDANPQVTAAVIAQESSFRNWRVHRDDTGHGLVGLDDRGLLADFEAWSGLTIGRGAGAALIPPGMQIAYLAKTLAAYAERFGGPYQAARAWHRGEAFWDDQLGTRYERLIRQHVRELFG